MHTGTPVPFGPASIDDRCDPDTILPSQFAEMRHARALSPEQRLLLAMLGDAIDRYFTDPGGKGTPEYTAWLFDRGNRKALTSFDGVCAALGLDPEVLRDGLVRARKEERTVRIGKISSTHGRSAGSAPISAGFLNKRETRWVKAVPAEAGAAA